MYLMTTSNLANSFVILGGFQSHTKLELRSVFSFFVDITDSP